MRPLTIKNQKLLRLTTLSSRCRIKRIGLVSCVWLFSGLRIYRNAGFELNEFAVRAAQKRDTSDRSLDTTDD